MRKFASPMFVVLSIAFVITACAPSPVDHSATQTAIIFTSDATKLGIQQTKIAMSTEYAIATTDAVATYEEENAY